MTKYSILFILLVFITLAAITTTTNAINPALSFRGCVNEAKRDCSEAKTLKIELNKYHTKHSDGYDLDKYKPTQDEITTQNLTDVEINNRMILNAEERLTELTSWESTLLWLMYWSCDDNAEYECMRQDAAMIKERGYRTVKYRGKWPFVRYLGCQEIASTLFSILNFVPFIYYFFTLHKYMPTTYYMYPLFFGYTISGMNTWIWSTAFHARDKVFTERLDYFCATFSILYLLNMAIIRVLYLTRPWQWAFTIIPSLTYFYWHCYTLHYIDFDYDWNMNMMVAFGCTYCLLFIFWSIFSSLSCLQSSTMRQNQQYSVLKQDDSDSDESESDEDNNPNIRNISPNLHADITDDGDDDHSDESNTMKQQKKMTLTDFGQVHNDDDDIINTTTTIIDRKNNNSFNTNKKNNKNNNTKDTSVSSHKSQGNNNNNSRLGAQSNDILSPFFQYRWRIALANVLILVFASCEVFDFPPYFDIFDAHSIWHFATPLCTLLTFRFAIDDAKWLELHYPKNQSSQDKQQL